MSALLPEGFAPAEPFVSDWVLPDAAARMAKRQASTLAELQHYYDTMLPLGEAALAWLRGYDLGEMPVEGERLLKLMLMLAEAAPAVEWYNGPRVTDGFPIERVRYLRQIPDNVRQM